MTELLKKMIETTNQLVKPFNIHKTVCLVPYFYLGSGKAFNIKFFNEKNEEIRCNVDYHSSSFIVDFTNFLNALTSVEKVNSGTLTIYPSGEYESSFIWDNAAYLEKLVFKAENLFSLLYYEISACPAFKNAEEEPISWQEATVSVSFKSGKVQGLNVTVTTATDEIVHYSEVIEEKFGESEYQSSRGYYEETYQLMNEGELKALYPRWNIATIHIKYGVSFDFEKHVILEWREENA